VTEPEKRMKHYFVKSDIGVILFLASVLFLGTGWVLNLIKIFNMDEFSGELVLRVAGVFIVLLGGIVGWF